MTNKTQISDKFWCKNYQGSENCCYNHFIGLPEKDEVKHPIYPYEEQLLEDIEKYQFLAIVKATGLGITEFFLRYAEWKALTDYKNAYVVIFTGPNIDLAKIQIERIKKHLLGKINFESDAYQIKLNSNTIKAFPSMNIDSARSLVNPKLILVDEAAFFGMVRDTEVLAVVERYELKSDAKVVIYSTPGLPEGMFYDLIREEPSKYKKRYLDYTKGLQPHPSNLSMTIYDRDAVEEAKKSHSFEQEYNLQFGLGRGNIFPYQLVEKTTMQYDLGLIGNGVLCIDPAYGSSKFGIVGMEKIDGIIQIKEATQYERPSPSAMTDIITTKSKDYPTILVDSAHPGLIRDLQDRGVNATPLQFGSKIDNKNTLLSNMTIEAAQAVREERVRIHPIFEALLSQLKAVEYNDKGHPDKKKLTFDLGDCFLMGVYYFKEQVVSGRIMKSKF